MGTTQREQLGHDHPRQSPLAIEFLQLLEDDRILHAAGDVRRQEGDVRERRVDLVGDECGDLPDRGPALALDQATLVFLLRRHVTRDDLHVGVRALLPDDAGPDLEETARAVLEFQVRFERLRDRAIVQEVPEVQTATLEFSRGEQFPEIDPPEGRRVLGTDDPGPRGIRLQDRAASIDQERGIRRGLEQLPEPGLRPLDELLRALAFRDVAADGRAADQSTDPVPQGGD